VTGRTPPLNMATLSRCGQDLYRFTKEACRLSSVVHTVAVYTADPRRPRRVSRGQANVSGSHGFVLFFLGHHSNSSRTSRAKKTTTGRSSRRLLRRPLLYGARVRRKRSDLFFWGHGAGPEDVWCFRGVCLGDGFTRSSGEGGEIGTPTPAPAPAHGPRCDGSVVLCGS